MRVGNLLTQSLIGSALLLPVTAMAAEGLSYTFIEANYLVQDVDFFEDDDLFDNFLDDTDDGDGFGVQGSVAVTNNLFVFGAYTDTESEYTFFSGNNLLIPQNEDIKTLRLGAGFNLPLADKVDLVARASYVDIDIGDFNLGNVANDDLNSGDDLERAFDDLNEDPSDGFSVDIGARAQLANWLEIGGGARYTDLDTGDDVSVFGNLLFEISDYLGINLSGDFGDDISVYSLGFRYSF